MRCGALGLLAALSLGGCYQTPHAPELAVVTLKDEIATLGSYAKIDGRRTPELVALIASDVATAIQHVDEIK